MSLYQVLLTAALLMVCKPGVIGNQADKYALQSVELQIIPSSSVVFGSTELSFNCIAMANCMASNGCEAIMGNVTWLKDGEVLDDLGEYIPSYTSPMFTVPSTNDSSNVTIGPFVLMINGSVRFSDAAMYECEISFDGGSVMTSSLQNLTVQFPEDFLSVSLIAPMGVVGSSVTLTCAATLSVDVAGAMVNFDSNRANFLSVVDHDGNQTSSNYTISPVTPSSAGEYICIVTVTVPNACGGGESELTCPTSNDTALLTLQFPSSVIKSVVLTPTNQTREVNSSIAFTCMATLFVDVSGASIEFDFGFINKTINVTAGLMHEYTATLAPVSLSSASEYTCTVTVTALNVCGEGALETDCPANTSDPVTLTVITIMPEVVTQLDIAPYNAFELYCTLIFPMDSNLMGVFSWTEETEPIPGNTTVSTSNAKLSEMNNMMSSVLSVVLNPATAETVFSTTYRCMAGLDGGNTVNVTAVAIVRGPASPNPPLLGPVNVFPDEAFIDFTVGSVSYDPENYTIFLWDSENDFSVVNTTLGIGGPADFSFLTAINTSYTIRVGELSIFQKYYYVITATNSVGSTNSTVSNFTTAEAPPGPPSNVNLRIDMPLTLYLSWEEPEDTNGNITGYSYSCYFTNLINVIVQQDMELESEVRSAIIDGSDVTGLTPFTSYTCSVTGFTSAGEGPPATATATSASAAPTGVPLNFEGMSTNPTILTLSWNEPQLNLRNGIIVYFSYWCEGVHMGGQMTPSLFVDVTGLTAFTDYTCHVSAATVNGTGPADTITRRTAEDRPGVIGSLSVSGLMTQFNVEWTPPNVLNGVIDYYYILVYLATTSDKSLARGIRVPGVDSSVVVTGLDTFVPYNVTVFAATGAGNGTGISTIDFTEEGTPGPVTVSNVTRVNGTHITVTWVPLTLEEAQGFITEYTIMAIPAEELTKRQDSGTVSGTFPASASTGTLGGLTPGMGYGVVVIGNTVTGTGTANPAVVVPTVTTPTNAGAIAGAVIGSLVVIVLLLAGIVVVVYFYFRTRDSKSLVRDHERLEEVEMKSAKGAGMIVANPIPVERFAKHVADYHQNKDLGFEEEYLTYKYLPMGPHTVCKLPSNTSKNRFENVFPFDNSRVRLTEAEGEPGSDYINASWIDGYRREKAFIASQGPLVNTISDFWRMVWEYKMPTIVMLTELVERGVNKCAFYWPKNINEKMDLGYDLNVTLVEQRAYVEYKLKRMLLVNTSDEDGGKLEVTHYHFTAWPDHGVPADKTCMLAFIKRIRKAHPPTGPPLLVHCSAGVGRTGTFITLDTMLQRMKEENNLTIPEFMKEMRSKRVLMVQTEAQYIYIHDALAEFITCGDTSIHATSGVVYKRIQHLQTVTNHQSGFQHQFELLRQVSIKATEGHCSDALSSQNAEKNRYRHLVHTLPFNFNRVRLKSLTGEGDYINASYVDGYKHRGAFLATQSPLKDTVSDVWRMVWENQSKAIVMLCDVSDSDDSTDQKQDEDEDFPKYWPTTPGEKATYGKLSVKLISEKQEMHSTVRKMELAMDTNYVNMGSSKADTVPEFVVTQYHYSNWPKSGKPSKPGQLVRLIENLIKTQSNTGNNPITVMCSDGVGRTGAFICIYSVLERVKTEGVADIFQFIKSSRFQRSGLVKELDQYILCHEVLQEFLSTFDNYANF